MRYFLGADIGGTNTRVLICDQNGCPVGFGEARTGNPEAVGYSGLAKVFRMVLDAALTEAGISAGQIYGAGFGVAGYDWPSQTEETLAALAVPGMHPHRLVNDTVLGILAGSDNGWGIAVVSGTGCNCWGWDAARMRLGRMTGGGTWMGEGAGASELVAKALQAVAQAWTLRGPQTQLGAVLAAHAGAKNAEDLLEGLMSGKYGLHASAAPLVFQTAEAGDAVACGLIEWAGCELAEISKAVIRQLGFQALEFDVVLMGSMFAGGARLIEPMRRTILAFTPGARLVRLQRPPVTGALLLGMEDAGWSITPAVRQTVLDFKPAVNMNSL
jgi:N-acetylglucosamine kinase-like BadF-type ATPase